ncbi:mitochondrial import receptor subunit tom20 [Coemansia sp. RSA 1813]|nr:mitochondrial import receptor subunit tom20 [Coemansia sp. RSA 1843]KAJ2091398.1 mitochondrial import receptor subunit tom20 [Coemansia sp. RSA 986]KAJ2212845.1 mitochondrial import receptor subunit tom20 [Coemansia sp. RSA 487]KAJ2569560.1 mitochondrial import receptor subunit tom20 [Coemansia sp. RSA 1813]
MVTGKTIAVAATVTAAVAGLGYIAYFDYKRRHDRKFRRKLKRDRKKVEKKADDVNKTSPDAINDIAMELLNEVAKDKLPASPEEKEQFFMTQVSKGETLCSAGPSAYSSAACHFYQALKVYPNPVELVMIYQKTTPPEVFKLVMAMMAQEVRQKQLRYFDVFPAKGKNVQIKDKNKTDNAEKDKADAKPKGKTKAKKPLSAESDNGSDVIVPNRALFSTKDFDAGETIYEEEAVVSTLLPRAQNGQFCDHCMKSIPSAEPRSEEKSDPEAAEKEDSEEQNATEKSEEDKEVEGEKTDTLIEAKKNEDAQESEGNTAETEDEFKDASENNATSGSEKSEETKEIKGSSSSNALECDKCHKAVYCSEKCRQDAYDAYHQFLCTKSDSAQARQFAELVKETHELAPILIAKFFGILVDREKKKELARALGALSGSDGAGDSDADEYTTWEHLECMRYLELVPSAADAEVLKKLGELMSSSVPGLTEFVTSERYTMLKGKLDYNAFAVHNAQDVDVPAETEATHVSDTIRDDHSASPVGISLYLISSHVTHSCDPNVQIVFPDNTSKAAIKTLKPVAKGDELHVSFVDASLDVQTRQKLLKNSYRFTCECDKCKADLAAVADKEEKVEATAEENEKAETTEHESSKDEN